MNPPRALLCGRVFKGLSCENILGKHVHLVYLRVIEVVRFSISGCQKLFMHNLLDFVSLSSFSISVRPEYVNGLFCET